MKLKFRRCKPLAGRKTSAWEVYYGSVFLGFIIWRTQWRCYAFCPEPDTAYEEDCLRDIAAFVAGQTKMHRYRLKKKKEEV